jgi:hypothetical protein
MGHIIYWFLLMVLICWALDKYHKKNTETLFQFSRGCWSRNKCRENKVYDHVSSSQLRTNQNIRTANVSFENVAKFKYLGMMLTNQNDSHDEIKSSFNSENACYLSVQNLLSSHLI